jgi:hypothetical protein
MNALVRKELRQVLPGQMFQSVLLAAAGLAILDPHEVLAPFHENQAWLHAVVAAICFMEGVVLGYGQFAYERWMGTEAYLVHRSTGRAGAFHAKARAGLLALTTLAVLPAATFGAFHLGQHPYAGSASVVRLLLVALASCTAFVGYGAGSLAYNLGRTLLGRVGLALAISATVFFVVALAALPLTFGPRSMALRFAVVVVGLAALLLWSGRHAFASNEGRGPARARVSAFAFGVIAALLCLPPLALLPYFGVAWAITGFEADAPELVEDDQGELFVATPTNRDRMALWQGNREFPHYGRVYEIVDLQGVSVPEARSLHYAGRFGNGPFELVFDASYLNYRRLGQDNRIERWIEPGLPFGLTGSWLSRSINSFSWCFERSSGEHWIRDSNFDSSMIVFRELEPLWRRLDERTPDLQVIYGVSGTSGSPIVLLEDESRFLRLVASNELGGAMLVDAPLPNGDRFVEMGMLYGEKQARLGLSTRRRSLVIGERGRYVWNGLSWISWDEVEGFDRSGLATLEEIADLQRWTLEVTPAKGLGYHVAFHDSGTGARVAELAVRARTAKQYGSEWLATLSCLALPPISAVRSWFQPLRAPQGLLRLAFGSAEVDPLRGQRRTWVVATLVALAAWLVRDLGRRLARRRIPAERRVLWCLLAAAFGLPAYVLGRTIERNFHRSARAASSVVRTDQALVIRTA